VDVTSASRGLAPSPEWVLWSGTVGLEVPLPERIDAASAAGATHVSWTPHDLPADLPAHSRRDIAQRAADKGVALSVVDPIMRWLPDDASGAALVPMLDDVLAVADEVGLRSINVIHLRPTELGVDDMAEHFAAVCDRAADHGVRVHVEFAPRTALPDLATAWSVVDAADRPNGGLLIDNWHFFRGDPDFHVLAGMPGERVFAVQLSDADAICVEPLYEDTMHRRRLPGDGDFDVARFVEVLAANGALGLVGPEVFSDELHARGPRAAAAVAMERTRMLVTAAGSRHG
jgi:sugar phosphate isomerase/epimerase